MKLPMILSIPIVFGVSAFLYSFFGYFSSAPPTVFSLVSSLTFQEIGGHFLFGYIVALPTRNLKLALMGGLMALTIDADHAMNALGFHLQGRISHSISFAFISSVIIGLIVIKPIMHVYSRMPLCKVYSSLVEVHKNAGYTFYASRPTKNMIFSQFMVITVASYMSHIAYDAFVDPMATFPLFAPFNFDEVFFPQDYGLPIEGAAALLVYTWYIVARARNPQF
jgi:hypothetical protein